MLKCSCCSNPQVKTGSHVFVNSPMARHVWPVFEDLCNVHCVGSLLQHKINAWWLQKIRSPSNKARYILSLIPTSICWELWLNRNSEKFEHKSSLADQIVTKVKDNVMAILTSHLVVQKRC